MRHNTMGFGAGHHHAEEPHSTPKLSLSKLPYKRRSSEPEPLSPMLTPPLRPSVSIPFHWEEAPGKPRTTTNVDVETSPRPPASLVTPPSSKNIKAARCLDLPPRMLHDQDHDHAKITNMPSPTTVLDGPYVGRSLSLACTFSFRKGVIAGRGDEGVTRPVMKRSLGSGRWAAPAGSFRDHGKFVKGSSDISRSLGEFFKNGDDHRNVKITRVRRRKSFFSLSTINSNVWGDIYASLKQAVPWRRR